MCFSGLSFVIASNIILPFAEDNAHLVNTEIQKRVMREFGYLDSFACEVFRHAPDIIEDSCSSSGSSRHSTLSKVGLLFLLIYARCSGVDGDF